MNATCFDIATLLGDNGFGTFGADGDIYAFAWNESIDAQILVLDSGNIDVPLKDFNEQPMFQILVRGKKNDDINTVHTLIRSIHEFLIVQTRQTINLAEYLEYEPMTGIISLGRDDNNRFIFSSNYYTFRESL